MPHGRKRLGDWGESVAATHLEACGYQIIHRSWRCEAGEADLIALRDRCWVLVEVKTRRGAAVGSAEQAVTPAKAQKLLLVAAHFCATLNVLEEVDIQIDVIAVQLDKRGKLLRLTHYENAIAQWI